MFRILIVSAVITLAFPNANGHSYHLGGCPNIEPQRNFDMNKMLGIWYAVEKTSTASSCVTYNFTKTDEPFEYELVQTSQHFILKHTPLNHVYRYTGRLTVPDNSIPGKMIVKFPLNVGSAAYTIISTDYNSYALIYSCQKVTFANRQSATILSRDKILDKEIIVKLRDMLSDSEIDPHDLSIINQLNCPKMNSETHVIDIDDETLSAKSVGNVLKGAGNAIANGAEYVVGGVGTLVDKIRGNNDNSEKLEKFD